MKNSKLRTKKFYNIGPWNFDLLVLTILDELLLIMQTFFYTFYQTSYIIEGVNCTEPSPSDSVLGAQELLCHPNVSRPNCFDQKTWKCFRHPNVSRSNHFQPKDMEVFFSSSKCQSAKLFSTKRCGSVFVIQMSVGQIVFDQKTWRCFCQPNVSWPNCFFFIKRPTCFHHPNVSQSNCFRPKEVGPFCQLNVSRPNHFQPREVEVFLVIQMSVGQIVFDQKTW
jgi:hypothetical protein